MNRNKQDVIDTLEEFKDYEDTVFIVEGKRDKAALISLGIKNIITYSSNSNSIEKTAYNVKKSGFSNVVILTDFDEPGKRLNESLVLRLREYDINPNEHLRNKFKKKFRITDIEEMTYYKKNYFDYKFV